MALEQSTKKYPKIVPSISVIFLLCSIAYTGIYIWQHTHLSTIQLSRGDKEIQIPDKKLLPSEIHSSIEAILPVTSYPHEGKAVVADLSGMKIYLMLNGSITEEYPLLSKGLEGSRYETPTGAYTINYKEENHKVTVRDIYMPYSMHFFGNFFIHGRPVYEDGHPLVDGPSGGCIRLTDDVATKVYAFADMYTPVYIIENNGEDDPQFIKDITPFLASTTTPLDSTGDAYMVSDLKTGVVLSEKNAEATYSIYSISKLMAAIVADESFRDSDTITIDPDIHGEMVASTSTHVISGDTLNMTDILYPIIFTNDDLATYSVATNIGSLYYAVIMTQKSKAIGMDTTVFADPAGRDDKSVSTAKDLALLSRYMYFKHPYLAKLTTQHVYTTLSELGQVYTWTNESVGAPQNAKLFYTMKKDGRISTITIVPMHIAGEDRLVSIVVLNSLSQDDTQKLIDGVRVRFSR